SQLKLISTFVTVFPLQISNKYCLTSYLACFLESSLLLPGGLDCRCVCVRVRVRACVRACVRVWLYSRYEC
ncbi:hypothetical protein GBAR_LOCUS14810, partial [Geodia barretti]